MKTVIIHGQSHKGSTYHIAAMLAEKIGGETTEFFLPKDFDEFCCGCAQCFTEDEAKCPHAEKLSHITQALADSLFFWGVPKIYKFGIAAAATNWKDINEKKKSQIEKKTYSIASKILKNNGRVKAGLKPKGFFFIMRMLQKNGQNEADVRYWKDKGWIGKTRPWKQR